MMKTELDVGQDSVYTNHYKILLKFTLQYSFEIHIAISTLEKERIFIDKMSLFPRRQFFPHLQLFILPGEEINHNICSEATTDSITDYG